jgi:zinc protease
MDPNSNLSFAVLLAFGLAASPGMGRTFLPPDLSAGQTSPTVERQGVTIPLRPEMLPESPPSAKVPVVHPISMPSGITLFVHPDSSLPRVDVVVMVRAGSIADPTDLPGVAQLTGEVIRAGGSRNLTPKEVDDQLESLGCSLDVGIGPEAMTFRLFSLASHADKAFSILSSLLQQPRFDERTLETRRGVLIDDVLRQEDEPSALIRRTFRQVVYGGGHPLGRTATTSSLTAIGRPDVQKHHQQFFHPNQIFIGITGDITEAQARHLVGKYWDSWKPADKPKRWPTPTADKAWDTTSGVVLLPKRTQQTQIRVGHIGIPRKHADRYAVNLLNTVFGTGGFSSRLMDRVRSMKGLAYGAGGSITSDAPAGLFFAAASTQTRTTAAALREILAIIRETARGDVTEAELETARRDLVYSFLNGFETPTAILTRSMESAFVGEDEDFLLRFVERTSSVTLDQVNAAARNHLHPDRLKIVLVGFEKAFEKPVDEFGPVTRLKPDGTPTEAPSMPLPPEARQPNDSSPAP